MTKRIFATGLTSVLLFAGTVPALAQVWTPGSEIVGHSIQVETNGVMNTIHFDPGGQARIVTPGGNVIPAAWTAANGQLCLNTGAAQECWPYQAAFQAGQPITLVSSCQSTSRWLAASTNEVPPPMAAPERG